MIDYIEIDHRPIKLSDIKDVQIVDKEMIMRPVFREVEGTLNRMFSSSKYRFVVMEPFGIIIGENGNGAALTGFKPVELINAVVKDVMRPINAVVDTIGDRLDVKTLKYKEYKCKLLSGRVTQVYLQDVPAKLITKDLRPIDVYKYSPEFKELDQNITASVQLIKTLQISLKSRRDEMLFFGEGIDPINIYEEYDNILHVRQACLEESTIRKENNLLTPPNITVKLPKVKLPKINISIGKPQQKGKNN